MKEMSDSNAHSKRTLGINNHEVGARLFAAVANTSEHEASDSILNGIQVRIL